ncbi:hypothetical protein KM043_007265 [Ampulex compressa]|nr:hypothetical protein KM043_007265 [Ampulex compressa]
MGSNATNRNAESSSPNVPTASSRGEDRSSGKRKSKFRERSKKTYDPWTTAEVSPNKVSSRALASQTPCRGFSARPGSLEPLTESLLQEDRAADL